MAQAGTAFMVVGFLIAFVAAMFHSAPAAAFVFEGHCLDLNNAGICVLDEPEGKNPAVHGAVSYLRAPTEMTFTIDAVDRVTEVQICMQTSGPFAQGANVCAGSHGQHVRFTQVGNVYSVDLAAAGLAAADPLYWTVHVVAGGRTLQVIGVAHAVATTTTTNPPGTTTTVDPATTSTTTVVNTTTTSTTTVVNTTTTSAASTTTVDLSTTTVATPTTTTVAISTTTTTLPVQVLPSTLARTGGPHWWALLLGAGLMLVGVTLLAATQVLARIER